MPQMRSVLLLLIFVTTARSEALWPEFRGPTAQGHNTAVGLPVKWSSSEGIAWRTEIPGLAWSSPVVANGKIFVTNASTDATFSKLEVLALDAATGKQIWATEVFRHYCPI